ncbi:hypothetical protein ADUPG1_010451 [Aduncisulcus paluster]|uniref:Membrane transport protein MMPL domain-containing protein n=1 Tax=Aduncisulcus paluster TaxID=2918883 RepID=A0ABQ5JWV5_9EUKA|nr:hypothetical protein ADUPG1_010451 [Aduncisulcus paluster]
MDNSCFGKIFSCIESCKIFTLVVYIILFVLGVIASPLFFNSVAFVLEPPDGSPTMIARAAMNEYFPGEAEVMLTILTLQEQKKSQSDPSQLLSDDVANFYDQYYALLSDESGDYYIPNVVFTTHFSIKESCGIGCYPIYASLESSDKTVLLAMISSSFGDNQDYVGPVMKLQDALYEVKACLPSTITPSLVGKEVGVDSVQGGIVYDLVILCVTSVPIAIIILWICLKAFKFLLVPLCTLLVATSMGYGAMYLLCFLPWDVSSFAPMIIFAAAVAFSLDYSLFQLTRFRQELECGRDPKTAVYNMLKHSGHTVVVSGSVIALAFFCVGVLPLDLVSTIGVGAGVELIFVVLVNVTLLPSILLIGIEWFSKNYRRIACVESTFGVSRKSYEFVIRKLGWDANKAEEAMISAQAGKSNPSYIPPFSHCVPAHIISHSRLLDEQYDDINAQKRKYLRVKKNIATVMDHLKKKEEKKDEEYAQLLSEKNEDGDKIRTSKGVNPRMKVDDTTPLLNSDETFLSEVVGSAKEHIEKDDDIHHELAADIEMNGSKLLTTATEFDPSGSEYAKTAEVDDGTDEYDEILHEVLELYNMEDNPNISLVKLHIKRQINSPLYKFSLCVTSQHAWVWILCVVLFIIPCFVLIPMYYHTTMDIHHVLVSGSEFLDTYNMLADEFGVGMVVPTQILVTIPDNDVCQGLYDDIKLVEDGYGFSQQFPTNAHVESSWFEENPMVSYYSFRDMNISNGTFTNDVSSPPLMPQAMFDMSDLVADILVQTDNMIPADHIISISSMAGIAVTRETAQEYLDHPDLHLLGTTYSFIYQEIVSLGGCGFLVNATVATNEDPFSAKAEQMTKDIRVKLDQLETSQKEATGIQFNLYYLGGVADQIDATSAIGKRFPLQVGLTIGIVLLVVIVTFRTAFMAVLLLISMGITLVFIFGFCTVLYCTSLFNTSVDDIYWAVPILAFSIICGLALDYVSFLTLKIFELREKKYTNKSCVQRAQYTSGSIINYASLVMASAFAGLMLSNIQLMVEYGIFLCGATLFDAFVIRGVFVPATMSLMGDALWWPRRMPEGIKRCEVPEIDGCFCDGRGSKISDNPEKRETP